MAEREITVTTPLGDELLFSEMSGHDEIGGCFAFTLRMASENLDIEPKDLLGKPVTVSVAPQEETRFFNGLVAEFRFVEIRDAHAHYSAVLRPWLWLLSNTTENRIFQNMSVVEIVEAVFGDYADAKYEKRLQGTYEPREYCVQYAESDLNFVQRLLEHEGIFYFFEHGDTEHRLVLTDDNSKLKAVPGFETIEYKPHTLTNLLEGDHVVRWSPVASVTSGAFVQTDYDFTKPGADLMSKSENPLGHSHDEGERYVYPGSYTELARGDHLTLVRTQEVQAPSHRVDAFGTARGLWSGATFRLADFPREVENDEFIVLRTDYRMWDDQYRSGADRTEKGFEATWKLAPKALPFRPERRAICPVMRGPQTATVVGPGGEEIFTDEYARVKVQFHWDRLGARDENSSCFVRVSSAWAGSGWGFIQIPRIGQEVIVDFLEGDPDQPIITGRVYNAAQMPPYGLPGNATQSGWKSNSSPGGGGWNELRFEDKAGSEEVYFQAQKDHNELVKNDESRTIGHDFSEDVGNDAQQSVGHDRTESVGNDKSTRVGNNRTVSIGVDDTETVGNDRKLYVKNDETIDITGSSSESIWRSHSQYVLLKQSVTVGGMRSDKVGGYESRAVGAWHSQTVAGYRAIAVGGYQKHTVAGSDATVIQGNQSLKVGKNQEVKVAGDQSFWVDGDGTYMISGPAFWNSEKDGTFKAAKNVLVEAGDQLTLKCGSATMVMKKDGTIAIDGKDITLNGKDIAVDGSGKINVKASGDLTMKGSKINQN